MPIQSFEERTLDRLARLETRFNDFISQDKPGSTRFTAGGVVFGTGGAPTVDATKFFWDNVNKRLGIGTVTPAAPLHIYQNAVTSEGLTIQNVDTSASGYAILRLANNIDNLGGIFRANNANTTYGPVQSTFVFTGAAGGVGLITNNVTRVFATSAGDVGINTTAPSRKFAINNNGAAAYMGLMQDGIERFVIGTEPGLSRQCIFYNTNLGGYAGNIDTGSSNWRIGDSTIATYKLELPNIASVAGQGRANAWVTYSSRDLKKNIKPIDVKALRSKLKNFSLVSFDWNNTETTLSEIGVIAEDLQLIAPELVTGDITKPETIGVKESKAGLIALALILDHLSDELPKVARI